MTASRGRLLLLICYFELFKILNICGKWRVHVNEKCIKRTFTSISQNAKKCLSI